VAACTRQEVRLYRLNATEGALGATEGDGGETRVEAATEANLELLGKVRARGLIGDSGLPHIIFI
jgi:hypothetical protein